MELYSEISIYYVGILIALFFLRLILFLVDENDEEHNHNKSQNKGIK